MGEVAVRHAMLYWYAHEYPLSQLPHNDPSSPLWGFVKNPPRRGTPAAAVLGATSAACNKRGQSDGNVGKATHAPTPRRNLRRLIDQYRSAARSRSVG